MTACHLWNWDVAAASDCFIFGYFTSGNYFISTNFLISSHFPVSIAFHVSIDFHISVDFLISRDSLISSNSLITSDFLFTLLATNTKPVLTYDSYQTGVKLAYTMTPSNSDQAGNLYVIDGRVAWKACAPANKVR